MNERTKAVVKSADRVLDVLETLSQKGRALTHTELGSELGIPKSSLSQLLGNLAQRGWLAHDPASGTYDIGQRLHDVVRRRTRSTALPELAQPLCDRITRLTGESSSLNLRRDDLSQRVCGTNSSQPLTYSMKVGEQAPLYAVSSGKVMLAWMDAGEVKDYLQRTPLKALTKKTITSMQALRQQLKEVRATGVAWSMEEYTPGIVGVAVPVFDGEGRLLGAFNVAVPSVRDEARLRHALVNALKDAALSLQKELIARQPLVADGDSA